MNWEHVLPIEKKIDRYTDRVGTTGQLYMQDVMNVEHVLL
jgi:hypothetical protein